MDRHDTLLLAGGSAAHRQLLRGIFQEHYNLLEAANTRQALFLLEQNHPCIAAMMLILTEREQIDLNLLSTDACRACLDRVPMIAVTEDDQAHILQEAFALGAGDVIQLDLDPQLMLRRIETVARLRLLRQELEEVKLGQARQLRQSSTTIVEALSSIIEYRSVESGQHILRIRSFARLLLEELARCCPEYGLTEATIGIISAASALHDVGKISIPDAILNKPGPLTPWEREQMKTHARTGCAILEQLGDLGDPEYMRYAHNICHYHHERWDGKGYPEGLAGDDIPICAQVVGLADVYDALTTRRVYKEAYPFDIAVNMILKGECGAFSPKLLECFKHIVNDYKALAQTYADGLDPQTETFDVALPAPSAPREDSMAGTYAKYQALVHYAGAFLLEVDLDEGLFHLIYNPYPDIASFGDISTLAQLSARILDELVVPEDREDMDALVTTGIEAFLREGLRRVNHTFRFRRPGSDRGQPFVVTLLRINPFDSSRRNLMILCRRAEEASAPEAIQLPAGITAICRNDPHLTLCSLGPHTHTLAGYTRQQLEERFGGQLLALADPRDRETTVQNIRRQLEISSELSLELRLKHREGHWVWFLARGMVSGGEDGCELLGLVLTDITAVKQQEEILRTKLDRYEIILAQTENVLFDWDVIADTISFSDTWQTLFGYPPINGRGQDALPDAACFHPDDLPLLFDGISNLKNGSDYEMAEVRLASAQGRYLWCRFRATAIRDESRRLVRISGIIINIDAEKQAQRALQDQAKQDALTKFLNKDAGRRQAEEYFSRYAGKPDCALLIIDLDDFKQVNDRFGHLFGDAVLSKVAREIKKLFRSQDILSRIGGDEFMVLMRGVSDRALVESRCARLLSIFRTAFHNQHTRLPLSCSIGIALGPEHGSSYVELFRRADQALYQAKNRGKNSFVFYTSGTVGYSAQQAPTALGAHIDSDDQPGLAGENIVHHAFQRLYGSDDVKSAVNDILALMGRQMNVSRVYVFENSPDNRFCSNTYEWCNHGIAPEIGNLQNISYETDIPNYESYFNEEGIFYCPDVSALPKGIYDIVAPQGIKSMLHCAIRDKGAFRGYVGFDECVTQRFWTKEQIQVLTYFSEMLSVFLLKHREQAISRRQAQDLSSILDNQNAWIYIIDPDSCELKYLNARTRSLAPGVKPGMRCYEALHGLPSRCENCPSAHILRCKNQSRLMENRKFDLQVLADATLIQWDGTDACLMSCRELPAGLSLSGYNSPEEG